MGERAEEVRENGKQSVGKWFVGGFLIGLAIEGLSVKKTNYSLFVGAQAATVGSAVYLTRRSTGLLRGAGRRIGVWWRGTAK